MARNLIPGKLPIGFVDAPKPIDPRGICGTCRYFIDDAEELQQELKHLSGPNGVALKTSERKRDAEGRETGEATARTFTVYRDLAQAIFDRFGLPIAKPEYLGMCEILHQGAHFTFRNSGSGADEHGRRTDQCSGWKERSMLQNMLGSKVGRDKNWRLKREMGIALRERRDTGPVMAIQGHEPCPWHPGSNFKACCGRDLV